MKEFLNNITRTIGFSDFGLFAFLYSFYLKIFKQLPYSVEETLKPERKDDYIKLESRCLFAYALIFISFGCFMMLTDIDRFWILIVHGVIYISVLCLQIHLKKELYL